MKMLIHGELGPEEQIVSGLRRGRVQYANLSALVASTLVPELALFYAPYLFDSEAEADYVIDNYLTGEYRRMLAAKGLEFICWYDLGYSVMWSRRKPLLAPADVRGIRFRIGSSRAAKLLAEGLRADTIPLPFSDIIPSLQRGLIEAGENGISLYARTGIAREAPHLSLTDHSQAMSVIVADKRWWDKQTPALQKILRDSFPTTAALRILVRREIATDLASAEKLGFKVYRLSSAQKQAWAQITRGTHPALVKDIGGDAARMLAGIEASRRAFKALPRPAG
jgi:TRAP-type C4-dicarboxylate transport system substrate-binding protein